MVDQKSWKIPDEFDDNYRHAPGTLAMANAGPNTGGSQFYLVDKDSTPSHLDGVHTVFGKATEGVYQGKAIGGIEVIDQISQVQTNPLGPTYIKNIAIDGDSAIMEIVIP
jgi:cyclophilin family peptidyl-prolyl cis-trans isomerase